MGTRPEAPLPNSQSPLPSGLLQISMLAFSIWSPIVSGMASASLVPYEVFFSSNLLPTAHATSHRLICDHLHQEHDGVADTVHTNANGLNVTDWVDSVMLLHAMPVKLEHLKLVMRYKVDMQAVYMPNH